MRISVTERNSLLNGKNRICSGRNDLSAVAVALVIAVLVEMSTLCTTSLLDAESNRVDHCSIVTLYSGKCNCLGFSSIYLNRSILAISRSSANSVLSTVNCNLCSISLILSNVDNYIFNISTNSEAKVCYTARSTKLDTRIAHRITCTGINIAARSDNEFIIAACECSIARNL